MRRKLRRQRKIILRLSIAVLVIFGAYFLLNDYNFRKFYKRSYDFIDNSNSLLAQDKKAYVYLSDIPYVKDKSFVGWGSLCIDKNPDGGVISLIVNGQKKQFLKGIGAHAKSEVVFDISAYDYDYLTTYVGLDASKGSNGNGIKLHIFTSMDGTNWNLETPNSPAVSKGDTEAIFYKVPIKGKKFIKLYANNLGNDTADHAVYANAKLIKEGYVETNDNYEFIKTVEEYDKEIKKVSLDNQLSQNEHLILKKEFVENVGYDFLQQIVHLNDEYKETVEWLFNDVENLRLYIMGGTPAGGSYYNSLVQLSRLYHEYGEDFKNTKLLNNKWYPKMTYGDLYKKMAITLSLTHSQTVALWMHTGPIVNQSDALRRYAIFKYLHDDGKLKASATIDRTEWFEALNVEEMRFIMNNAIDDEEILWLNAYVKTKIIEEPNKAWLTPHPHMAYVWPDYTNKLYYENDEYFNDLFKVKIETINANYVKDKNKLGLWDLTFVIPGGKNTKTYEISITKGTINNKISKVWMNFRNKFGTGAVCGGISKSGSNIRTTHGIPATVIGQPGHAALLFYSKTAEGKGYWGIDNDVSGWTLSEKGERMLNGWGNASYQKGYSVVYMVLAQEALNDFENYTKSQELVMLADVYKGDNKKQEEIYRKAIKAQTINIDAWYGLVSLYLNDTTKTEKDYYNLAEEIAGSLKNFPLPMYHMTNLLKGKLTSVGYSFQFTLLQTKTLEYGSTTKTTEVLQPGVTNTEAKYLLGKLDKELAKFSFDGEDANKIILAERFNGSGVRWDYSIDGKKTWKEVSFTAEEAHKWKLTEEEVGKITEENDIYIHIVGTNYSENNLYKIDITKGSIPSNYFANDLENRVVGVGLDAEWRYTSKDKWTSYKDGSPDLTGDKTVEVRIGATGTKLASEAITYNFSEDNQPNTRKYIPVSHLSIAAVSTEATGHAGHATNAIDANYNTRYHSDWNGKDTNRFMTIKLDKPVYLSAVEFVPAGGGNGKIYDGTIYGSKDGENWVVLSKQTGLTYKNQADTVAQAINNIKSFEIESPQEVQYVKIVADRTNGNWFTARAFNFYQDITKNPHPTAGIGYSTTEATNGNVVARLVNPSADIRITNNNGSDTYTFTKNGEFTFEFEDKETGLKGTAKAVVDWIDRKAPTATVKYTPSSLTTSEVLATITPSEAVRVLNYQTANVDEEGNQLLTNKAFTYTFTANGEFTIKFVDAAGNEGSIKLKVDWIGTNDDTNKPTIPPTEPTTITTKKTTTKKTTSSKKVTSTTKKATTKTTTTKKTSTKKTTKKIAVNTTNQNTITNKPQDSGTSNKTTTKKASINNETSNDTSISTTSNINDYQSSTTKKIANEIKKDEVIKEDNKKSSKKYLVVISLIVLLIVIAIIIAKIYL